MIYLLPLYIAFIDTRYRCLCIAFFKALLMDFPLCREHLLLFRITRFTGWNQVKLLRPPPPGQWNHMIHGEFPGGKVAVAVMADPG